MGEEYLQLSLLAPLHAHRAFYGRCAVDVLEVLLLLLLLLLLSVCNGLTLVAALRARAERPTG